MKRTVSVAESVYYDHVTFEDFTARPDFYREAGYWSDAGERQAFGRWSAEIFQHLGEDDPEIVDLGCGPDPLSLGFLALAPRPRQRRTITLVDSHADFLSALQKAAAGEDDLRLVKSDIFDEGNWLADARRPTIFLSGGVFSNYPLYEWRRLFDRIRRRGLPFRLLVVSPRAHTRLSARRGVSLLEDSLKALHLTTPAACCDLIYNFRFGGRWIEAHLVSEQGFQSARTDIPFTPQTRRARVFLSRRFLPGEFPSIAGRRLGLATVHEWEHERSLIWWAQSA